MNYKERTSEDSGSATG